MPKRTPGDRLGTRASNVTVTRSVDCGRPLKNLHGNEYSTHKRYLAPALKALARRCTVPVQLDVRTKLRLPERVEVAAYYVIAEALTNAAKHGTPPSVAPLVRAHPCTRSCRWSIDLAGPEVLACSRDSHAPPERGGQPAMACSRRRPAAVKAPGPVHRDAHAARTAGVALRVEQA